MTNVICERLLAKGVPFNEAHQWRVNGTATEFKGAVSAVAECAREGCEEIGYIVTQKQESEVAFELPETEETRSQPVSGSRTRVGDQRLPSALRPEIDDQEMVIEDIRARRELGIERYGQAHQPWNGRDTLRDFYEEQLDGLVYLRSILRMTVTDRDTLASVIRAVLVDPDIRRDAQDSTQGAATFYADEITNRVMGYVAGNTMRQNLEDRRE